MLKTVLGASSIIRIQSWDIQSAAPATIESALGVSWPRTTGTIARGRTDVLCIGPTDWLVLADNTDADAILRKWFDEALEGTSFRATNVSQALSRIEIKGPEVRDLLAKGCSLDLHPPIFPPGRVLRTRFAGMPVIIRCSGTSTFELIVARSYIDYLNLWLDDAALEFEMSVV